MSEDLPRIQVDSKADIHYLRRELLQALETSLWSSSQAKSLSNNAKREKVRLLMEKWLSETFSLAGSSIEINGRPYQKAFLEEEVEAFDGELKVKVTGLQAKVDALLLRVCALRKDVPRQVADLTRRTLSKESDRVMRRLASRPSGVLDPPPASYISRPASSVNPSILEEYQETLKAINRLKKSIPGAHGRLERALDLAHDQLQQMGLPVDPAVDLFIPGKGEVEVGAQDERVEDQGAKEGEQGSGEKKNEDQVRGGKRVYEEIDEHERRKIHQGVIRRLAQDRKRRVILPM
ncbi:MAG: hypothetical protein DHS80DRAFT_32585 [Piptocephalis tieghemiana]|nr:MAG: hypothetical protein DHS80DRAFT_32585 [Piptocephalis tieghemiana]